MGSLHTRQANLWWRSRSLLLDTPHFNCNRAASLLSSTSEVNANSIPQVHAYQSQSPARPRRHAAASRAVAADREVELDSKINAPSTVHSQPANLKAEGRYQASPRLKNGKLIASKRIGQEETTLDPPPLYEARQLALAENAWAPNADYLDKDALWATVQEQARKQAVEEPVLASYLHMTVIMHATMEKSMAFLLANKLASTTLLGTQLARLIKEAYDDDPQLLESCIADVQAVYERDPACQQHIQCMLFFKGFQAIQAQRVANWMWNKGRRALAVALQSRMSEVFGVDIHPAATIGKGVMIDHATGVVVGETAVIGDNVSMLHHVTLGGSGTGVGVRHPTIGNGVLLGAGVSVLGPVVIGQSTKVGAGSVVVTDLPPHCVAVGVPGRVVRMLDGTEMAPADSMDQVEDLIWDYMI